MTTMPRFCGSVLVAAGAAGVALAQPADAPKPAPKPPEQSPAPGSGGPKPSIAKQPADGPSAQTDESKKAGYPPTPPKNLFAANDLRNKPAPKLEAEEWLTAAPKWEGRTLLIDLWATWCKPCRDVIPELEQWAEKYQEDLVVVGVTSEKKSTIENFYDLRGAAIKYPIARDGLNRTYSAIGVAGIPHVLIISSDGIVRYQGFPSAEPSNDPLTEQMLRKIIDADKAERAKRAQEKVAMPAPPPPAPAPKP